MIAVPALRRLHVPGWMLALLVLAASLALRGVDPFFVEELRLRGFDAGQLLWPRQSADDRVVVVEIDEESLAAKGQWPWPRDLVADLVRRIAAGKPAALGLDILFAEPDRWSPPRLAETVRGLPQDAVAALARLPENDELLAQAIGAVPTVLVVDPSGEAPEQGVQSVVTPVRQEGADPRPFLLHYRSLLRNRPALERAAAGVGASAAVPDRDGVLRRVPLALLAGGQIVPGFAAQLLAVSERQPSLLIATGVHGVERVVAGRVAAPTAADGQAILHFAPPELRYFSASDVLDPGFDLSPFAGRIVLLGVSALGTVDQKNTPLGLMEGVQIHAQLIGAMLDDALLRRPPLVFGLELAIILLAGGIPIRLLPYERPFLAGAAVLGLVLALGGGELALFRLAGWLVDGIQAGITALAIFAVMLAEHLRAAQAERRRLDRELAAQRERTARIQGELEAARAIQMGLLPRRFPAYTERDDIDLFAYIEPAREIGGDLFVFLLIDDHRLFFMIGDVSGKGIAAALFMAMTREAIYDAARRYGSALDRVLGEVNDKIAIASTDMREEGGDLMFVTAFAGVLDIVSGEVVYASAGHDAGIVVGTNGALRNLDTEGGPPLGVIVGFPFPVDHARLDIGEVLILYTDGITEAMDPSGGLYGGARLTEALECSPPDSAQAAIELVTGDVRGFIAGAEPADDMTLLALRRTVAASAAAAPGRLAATPAAAG